MGVGVPTDNLLDEDIIAAEFGWAYVRFFALEAQLLSASNHVDGSVRFRHNNLKI